LLLDVSSPPFDAGLEGQDTMTNFSGYRAISAGAICILLSVGELGCAGASKLAPMDPYRRIETERGYRQDGKVLDPDDMARKLEKEPAAAADVRRARTLGTIATVLGAAGGALVGWPLGEWAADDPHPTWPLAYAGAAALVISVPLVIWAGSSMETAVETHNREFGSDDAK
jgi:hypothetical protein